MVLQRSMRSSNLLLRRSAIDCLRQFSQREADIVSRYVAKICQSEEGITTLGYFTTI